MYLSSPLASVCLIACHGGPADHFATYADALVKQGYDVQIHAAGPALKKFNERGVEVKYPFSIDNLKPEDEDRLAEQIAKTCATASLVLTDVGHAFDVKMHQALSTLPSRVKHFAYYDNPEPFVPGGYSAVAAEAMQCAKGVLFANANLATSKIYSTPEKEIDFSHTQRIGLGYYPVHQADKIALRRGLEKPVLRAKFLADNKLEDRGQTIMVYFGGNNEAYFSKAFPAFLSFLQGASKQVDLTNVVVVLQQHPGAKAKNLDGQLLAEYSLKGEGPKIITSNFASDEVQVLADAAMYYQTSMGPQFALEGIPCIQIGHETYEDILVRNDLAPSVTSAPQFARVIDTMQSDGKAKSERELLLKSLGIREDWLQVLESTIQQI